MPSKYSDIFLSRISEIENCLEQGCYIAALSLSLTLPDICGLAEYHIEGVGRRYMQWYDKYVGVYEKPHTIYDSDMPYLSGEVVYNLRNSFLHAGNPNIEKEKIKDENCRIDHFRLEVGDSLIGDGCHVSYGAEMKILEREYYVNVSLFCKKLCKAAKGYYLENKHKFDFFHYDMAEV